MRIGMKSSEVFESKTGGEESRPIKVSNDAGHATCTCKAPSFRIPLKCRCQHRAVRRVEPQRPCLHLFLLQA
jgi:hypothetical protein